MTIQQWSLAGLVLGIVLFGFAISRMAKNTYKGPLPVPEFFAFLLRCNARRVRIRAGVPYEMTVLDQTHSIDTIPSPTEEDIARLREMIDADGRIVIERMCTATRLRDDGEGLEFEIIPVQRP